MHIPDGVLSAPVLTAGYAAAAAGLAIGLKKMDVDDVVRVSVMSSAFFVASLIHVPVGVASAHLLLNGFIGIALGWTAVPAIFVALLLQLTLFGFGGVTSLGINTVVMTAPALVCFYLFGGIIQRAGATRLFLAGFAAGASTVAFTAIAMAMAFMASGREFAIVAQGIFVAHAPVMVAEGFVTGFIVTYLRKVRPELLHGAVLFTTQEEAGRA